MSGLSLPALAASLCAAGPHHAAPFATDVADDGSAWVVGAVRGAVCAWTVDDGGDARLHHAWPEGGPRPVAIQSLRDGTALLVLDDLLLARLPAGGDPVTLQTALPSRPTRILAHPDGRLVAFSFAGADTTLVWVVDAVDGRLVASLAVPGADTGLSFRAGDPALYVDGPVVLALTAAATRVAP